MSCPLGLGPWKESETLRVREFVWEVTPGSLSEGRLVATVPGHIVPDECRNA